MPAGTCRPRVTSSTCCEICNRHGILLIFDEVITGFGRLGTYFGADYCGVVPDMPNLAKCVTNGVIPPGGVICRDAIYDAMMHSGAPEHAVEVFHGYTCSGHPVALPRVHAQAEAA